MIHFFCFAVLNPLQKIVIRDIIGLSHLLIQDDDCIQLAEQAPAFGSQVHPFRQLFAQPQWCLHRCSIVQRVSYEADWWELVKIPAHNQVDATKRKTGVLQALCDSKLRAHLCKKFERDGGDLINQKIHHRLPPYLQAIHRICIEVFSVIGVEKSHNLQRRVQGPAVDMNCCLACFNNVSK